jgi:hypothetical protein
MNGYNNLWASTVIPQWLLDLKWIYGRPAEVWLTHLDAVEHTINKLKLTPLPREHYPTSVFSQQVPMVGYQAARVTQAEPTQVPDLIPDFPGGLKCPHLHYKRDIYLLNNQQWKTFSNSIIEGFKKKLSEMGTISFEQLVKTSEVINSLT